MHFVLQLQRALQPHGVAQVLTPPLIDLGHQRTPDSGSGFFIMGTLEPDEGGVGIAVDHIEAARFDQGAGLAHDLVAAHGDG